MPSCVVKSCKNHSGSITKKQGITFHRFPSANDVWKNDWVQIIRECRNENNWNPSKSSVICSIHFEENDLYTTKRGLLRVVAYTVPKKYLFETSSIKDDQPAELNTSSASQWVLFDTSSIKDEQPAELNISSASHGILFDTTSIKDEQPAELNTFSASHGILTEPSIREDQPTEANISSASQVELSKIVTPVSGVVSEQPVSVLYTLRERCMKKQLMKMHTLMQKQKKKIKTLNQKVRRLQNRNKLLKDILKNRKRRNYVDSAI